MIRFWSQFSSVQSLSPVQLFAGQFKKKKKNTTDYSSLLSPQITYNVAHRFFFFINDYYGMDENIRVVHVSKVSLLREFSLFCIVCLCADCRL